MYKHLHIKVKGKVQGVYYRKSAQEAAQRFGIRGYVRNESDGDVRIEAEGDDMQLDQFVTWCRKGPERAEVGRLEISEDPRVRNFSSFEIIR
ncbi:MAG: acylphosphatase [Flavobacteriales bacterium]|nr:acylphosphatase [Flavobacteriales bacterium]MCB9449567.1 acylphosphatase [Flavobacteriales bacterium]